MSQSILSLLVVFFVLAGLLSGPAGASAQSVSRINLAFVLPKATPAAGSARLSTGERTTYAAGVVAVGGLVAADDRGIYRTVQGPSGPSDVVKHNANDITRLGDAAFLAPALGVLYLTGGRGNRDLAWRAGLAAARAGIVGFALKEVVGRKRPDGPEGGPADEFHPFGAASERFDSFPSGHTLLAFSVATVWAGERPDARYAAFALASAVGLSRIVKGAHWPSDVFWGAVLGITQGRQALKGNANLLNVRF